MISCRKAATALHKIYKIKWIVVLLILMSSLLRFFIFVFTYARILTWQLWKGIKFLWEIFCGYVKTANIIYLEYISCHTWPYRYDRGKGYLTCFSIYILCAILVQHLQIIYSKARCVLLWDGLDSTCLKKTYVSHWQKMRRA